MLLQYHSILGIKVKLIIYVVALKDGSVLVVQCASKLTTTFAVVASLEAAAVSGPRQWHVSNETDGSGLSNLANAPKSGSNG